MTIDRKYEPVDVKLRYKSIRIIIGNSFGHLKGAGSRDVSLDSRQARIVAYELLAAAERLDAEREAEKSRAA